MAYITRSELQSFASVTESVAKAAQGRSTFRATAQSTVFLSHSHQDQDLIRAASNFLTAQGVRVYVDLLDGGMPEQTSAQTAARIKDAIYQNKKFILLATERSLASRWVPWELGYADGTKTPDHMACLVVKEDRTTFPGNEYLGLYARIETDANRSWMVLRPDGRAAPLNHWLTH